MSWNEDGFRMMPPPPPGSRSNNGSNPNRQPTPPRPGEWRNYASDFSPNRRAMPPPPPPGPRRNNRWGPRLQVTTPRPHSWNRNDNSNSNTQGMPPPSYSWRNNNSSRQATSPRSNSWRSNNPLNSNRQAMPPPSATARTGVVKTEQSGIGNPRNRQGNESSVNSQDRGHDNKRFHDFSSNNTNSTANKRHRAAVKPEPGLKSEEGNTSERQVTKTSNPNRQVMPPPVATSQTGVIRTEQTGMEPPPVKNPSNRNGSRSSVSNHEARGHANKPSHKASSTNGSSTTKKSHHVTVKPEPGSDSEEDNSSNSNRQVKNPSNPNSQVMPPPAPAARPGVVKTERAGMGPPPVRNPSNSNGNRSSISMSRHSNKRSHREGSTDGDTSSKRQRVVIDLRSDSEEEDKAALETHIIFVVDFSGSMNERDIRKKNGKKMKRWDAVFESINELVHQQVEQNSSSDAAMVVVSLVIFNNEAETLLEKMPLVGNGRKVLKALKTAHNAYKPRGGTGFAAGLERAKQLAKGSNGNVMVVFLSDGRPGDLVPKPPSDGSIPMQKTFKRSKKTYKAAGFYIEEMKATFQDRFNLQLICLFSDGKPWLEYLGQRYDGTFHMCELTLDDDNTPAPAAVPQARARAGVKEDFSDDDDDDDSDYEEDEVVEMKVKSQDTIIAERYARAKATGNVISIAATAQGSSIRSTFRSISSTVTAMRNGATRRPLQERQIKLENGARSKMDTFPATRMVLKPSGDGVKNAPGEKSNGRLIKISQQPFAQGGLRNVFRMEEIGPAGSCKGLVGKESRHEVRYAERLQFHLESSRCQAKAAKFAKFFNTANGSTDVNPIEVLCAEVYRLKDDSFPGGFRYLGVEEELMGNYEKWNSNNGFVLEADTPQNHVAQAFSHFSYEHSNQNEIVVDIQGSGYAYTDPQLHSKKKEYGRADRGETGFKDFFRTHKCNHICLALGLQKRENSMK